MIKTIKTIKSELGRFLWDTGGATVSIEFVLILTPMVIMMIGTIEASRLFWARNSLQYATEEAGRYAMTHTSAATNYLEFYAEQRFDASSYGSPAFVAVKDTAADPDTVTITGSLDFDLDIVVQSFTIPLEGKSTVPLIE